MITPESQSPVPESTDRADIARAELAVVRAEIDAIDDQMLELLARRLTWVHQVATIKARGGLVVTDLGREQAMYDRLGQRGKDLGIQDETVVPRFVGNVIAIASDQEHKIVPPAQG